AAGAGQVAASAAVVPYSSGWCSRYTSRLWRPAPRSQRQRGPPVTLVANRLSRRADELDEPETLAHAIAEYARLGDEAWWRLQPDNAALAGLAAAPLCELLGELPRLARTALYFGPRSVDDAALTLGRDHVPLPRPTPVPLRRVARDTIFFTHKDMAQAQVQVFLPRPPLATAAAPLARLFDQYMGADMSGAIFQELREARGLAYAATARIEPGRRADDPAAVRGVVATQADKVVEALALLLDLIRGRGLLPARVDAARESLLAELRTTRVAPRAIARRVYEWRERGELEDPRPAMLAEIPKISADALAAFVEEHARTPASISLLGDRSRLDLAALARRYDVIEVARADLFSYGPFPQELGGAA
ncbi:MAG: insulinase family protein, partial [Myxococcales bacterium]|nr:insulinase family protein [Myxococcales bacterium]